jgi:hypothetical protein
MTDVTGRKQYVDGWLRKFVDNILVPRYKHNFDNLIIVTGKEGSGKSHLAMNLCWLYAHARKIPFGVDQITFSSQEFLDKAVKSKGQILLYDEAVQGLMGQNWQDKTQQLIIQTLMIARKNRNLYVLCIPSIAYLSKYLVNERCVAMLETYNKNFTRGFASAYNLNQARLIYQLKKQNKHNHNVKPVWRFRFAKADQIVDMDAYENKKDRAIRNLINSTNANKRGVVEKKYFSVLNHYQTKGTELMSILGLAKSQAYKDIKDAKDYQKQVSENREDSASDSAREDELM